MKLLCLKMINIQNKKIESKFNFHKGKTTFMFTDVTTCFVVLESVASVQKEKKMCILLHILKRTEHFKRHVNNQHLIIGNQVTTAINISLLLPLRGIT